MSGTFKPRPRYCEVRWSAVVEGKLISRVCGNLVSTVSKRSTGVPVNEPIITILNGNEHSLCDSCCDMLVATGGFVAKTR